MSIVVPSSELIAAPSEYPCDTHTGACDLLLSEKGPTGIVKLHCEVSRQTDN